MSLGELIAMLKKENPDMRVKLGFANPHSYRGYYDELAFEPAEEVTVGSMLEAAESALDKTFTGYKGGDFQMKEHTTCWLANYGSTGETLGSTLVRLMLKDDI